MVGQRAWRASSAGLGDGADLAGDEPEDHAEDEAEEDLHAERDATETSEHRSAFRKGDAGRERRAGGSTGRGRHPAVVERTTARQVPEVLHAEVNAGRPPPVIPAVR